MAASASNLIGRLGLVVARPRAAFAAADELDQAGRAGTDLFVVLLALVAAAHTRELVGAAWVAGAVDVGAGARALLDVTARAITTPLALLLFAAVAIWVAAGRQRALGRDFDLACVAVVPIGIAEVVASLAAKLVPVPHLAVTVVAWLWVAALVVVGARQARRARAEGPVRGATGAGLAVVGAAVVLLGLNVGWVVTHLDWLRPMRSGDAAPPFALTAIEADGAPGPVVSNEDFAGRVVVLDFWATWCDPCLRAMPRLSALAAKGEVTVLSVNLDDPEAARELFDDKHYRTTLVADDGTTSDRYGVSVIPHMVVIDRDGVVRLVARGDGELARVIGLAEDLAR